MNQKTLSIPQKITALPKTPHTTEEFSSELENFSSQMQNNRATLVSNNKPLLAFVDTPRFENSQLSRETAYSIDRQNILSWSEHFISGTSPPVNTNQITFEIVPEQYSFSDSILSVTTEFGNIQFELSDSYKPDGNIQFQYTPDTRSFEIQPQAYEVTQNSVQKEVNLDFTEPDNNQLIKDKNSTTFPTQYDALQSLRTKGKTSSDVFAVYSPLVSNKKAKQLANYQFNKNMVIETIDGWKMCLQSSSEKDPLIKQSLVEVHPDISDSIETYYTSFTYPSNFIFLPELQYILKSSPNLLSEYEKKRHIMSPYAIPFGDETALFKKSEQLLNQQFTDEIDISQPNVIQYNP